MIVQQSMDRSNLDYEQEFEEDLDEEEDDDEEEEEEEYNNS